MLRQINMDIIEWIGHSNSQLPELIVFGQEVVKSIEDTLISDGCKSTYWFNNKVVEDNLYGDFPFAFHGVRIS
jgi:hypothetical protein